VDPNAYEVVRKVEDSHWFFVARRRILARLLDGVMADLDGVKALDVGCGTGATMGFLERYGEVTGVDVSLRAVEYCREQGRERLCLASGESLPFVDRSFDLVTALDLLEHLEHEDAGLREMWRVLKGEGRLVVIVPAFMFLWSEFDRFSGHYRRYTRRELQQRLEEAGFEVSKLTYFNTLLFPVIWAVRILKNLMGRRAEAGSDLDMPGRFLNGLLMRIFSLESVLIARGRLPFGVSLLCVAGKGPRHRSPE